MILILKGNRPNRGKRGELDRIENGRFYLKGFENDYSPNSIEFGEEELEVVKSNVEIMADYDIQKKFSNRYILHNRAYKPPCNRKTYRDYKIKFIL